MAQQNVLNRFADYAARIAHSVTANELGYMFYQLDTNSYYLAIAEGAAATSWAPVASNSVNGFIPVPIAGFHEADATILAVFADASSATPGYAVDNSEAPGIRWNNHANPDPVATVVPMPKDVDTNLDMTVYIAASKTGATVGDAVTWDVGVFFLTDGALHDADANAGETSSAMTGDATSKTVQVETATIDAADVPDLSSSSGAAITLTVQPTDGTLGTDDVTMHAIWIEYTRLPVWG